ncbi:hypothetical protein ACQEU6_10605 [Spirillospora sp. CA-108201]
MEELHGEAERVEDADGVADAVRPRPGGTRRTGRPRAAKNRSARSTSSGVRTR